MSYYISSGYTVELESVTIASSGFRSTREGQRPRYKAIFANAFSYIALPVALLTEIQTQLHPNLAMDDQLADLDCSMRDELPNIAFSFDKDSVIVLTPWDYLTEVQDFETGQRCVLPFTALEEFDTEWIVLGAPFMVGVHSTFDLERVTVSLAPLGK